MKSVLLSVFIGLFSVDAKIAEAKDVARSPQNTARANIEASTIHLGLKKPGMFNPARLYDGVATTSYCGVAGQPADVSFSLPMSGSG